MTSQGIEKFSGGILANWVLGGIEDEHFLSDKFRSQKEITSWAQQEPGKEQEATF
jgi:hypothetical protein